MGFAPNAWRFRSSERACVLLICPQCGEETPERVENLRDASFYRCRGADCDYRFEVAATPDKERAEAVAEA